MPKVPRIKEHLARGSSQICSSTTLLQDRFAIYFMRWAIGDTVYPCVIFNCCCTNGDVHTSLIGWYMYSHVVKRPHWRISEMIIHAGVSITTLGETTRHLAKHGKTSSRFSEMSGNTVVEGRVPNALTTTIQGFQSLSSLLFSMSARIQFS